MANVKKYVQQDTIKLYNKPNDDKREKLSEKPDTLSTVFGDNSEEKSLSAALKVSGICGLILGGLAIGDVIAFKGKHVKKLLETDGLAEGAKVAVKKKEYIKPQMEVIPKKIFDTLNKLKITGKEWFKTENGLPSISLIDFKYKGVKYQAKYFGEEVSAAEFKESISKRLLNTIMGKKENAFTHFKKLKDGSECGNPFWKLHGGPKPADVILGENNIQLIKFYNPGGYKVPASELASHIGPMPPELLFKHNGQHYIIKAKGHDLWQLSLQSRIVDFLNGKPFDDAKVFKVVAGEPLERVKTLI